MSSASTKRAEITAVLARTLISLSVAGAFGSVCAQESKASTGAAKELAPVTVSAGRGTQLEDLDVSTSVLTREQIQSAPETTVEQIINKIPGVFTLQQPAGQLHPTAQVFSMRGFGTTTNVNTLVMVDGVPMNDPYFRTVDWGQIPKDIIERIEVIRGGGATSLWGNMAMGGIVNIVTREPVAGEKHVHASYGSFHTATGDVSLGAALSETLKLGVSYGGSRSDGYNQTPSQYRNPNNAPTESKTDNLNLSLHFSPTVDSKYYLRLLAHRSEEEGLVWNIAKNRWDTMRLSGGGTTRLSERTSVNVNAWYTQGEMYTRNASLQNGAAAYTFNINNPGLGSPFVSQTETTQYTNMGGAAFVQTELGPIKDIKIGLDARRVSAEDPLNLYSVAGYQGRITNKATHDFQGLFAQGTYRPGRIPLDITVGLRQDFWQTSKGSIHGTQNYAAIDDTLKNQSYNRFDPRIGAKYFVTDSLDLRAAAYRNFAAPGMNQMYRAFISGNNYTTSNPDLKPQTNEGYEFGLDFIRPTYSMSATLFNNRLTDFIDYATVQTGCAAGNNYCGTGITTINGGNLKQYVNAGNAVFRGFELIGNWQVNEAVKLNGGFTRTDAHLTTSKYTTPSGGVVPVPTNEQLGQVPKWVATAGAAWQASAKLGLNLQVKSFPSYWNNTSHTQKNDAATIADLGVTYRLEKSVEIYGVAQNIGATRYYDQGMTYTTTNGSTVSTSAIPALGMPFNVTVGVRASF